MRRRQSTLIEEYKSEKGEVKEAENEKKSEERNKNCEDDGQIEKTGRKLIK
jgi:hypothetical protein